MEMTEDDYINKLNEQFPSNLSNYFLNLNEIPNCSYVNLINTENEINNANFTFLNLNIRSLTKNIQSLRDLLELIQPKNKKIDVICLTEIWKLNDAMYDIEGYHGPIANTRKDRQGGGVALYINKNLDFNYIEELSFMSKQFETVSIELAVKGKNRIISCCYRPPSKTATI